MMKLKTLIEACRPARVVGPTTGEVTGIEIDSRKIEAGNLFIAIGTTMITTFPHQWQTWAVFAAICLISMGVMLGMVKWLEKVTSD